MKNTYLKFFALALCLATFLLPKISNAAPIDSCSVKPGPNCYPIYTTREASNLSTCPNSRFASYYCSHSNYINCTDVPTDPYSDFNNVDCVSRQANGNLLTFMVAVQDGSGRYINCRDNRTDPACASYVAAGAAAGGGTVTAPGTPTAPTAPTAPVVVSQPINQTPTTATPNPTYTPLEPLPCIQGSTDQNVLNCANAPADGKIDFKSYVQYIYNFIIAIAAAGAVFMIVWGGFQYMTTDSWNGKSEGLNKVKNALLGLILILTSYLILRTVDPRLVAIPTTLVQQISIPTSLSNPNGGVQGLMNTVALDSTNNYFISNPNARVDIVNAQRDNVQLNSARTGTESSIMTAGTNLSLTGDNAATICDNNARAGEPDPDLSDLCAQRLQTLASIQQNDAIIRLEVAKGAISQKVNSCLSSLSQLQPTQASPGLTQTNKLSPAIVDPKISECISYIEVIRTSAVADLVRLGTSTRSINDFSYYSETMISVYGELFKYNPAIANNVDNVSMAGNFLMFIPATTIYNAYFTALKGLGSSSLTAAGTINNIRMLVGSTQVQDPAMRAQLQAMAAEAERVIK